MNTNSVPDYAEFTVDVRTTTAISHSLLRRMLDAALGEEAAVETLIDIAAVMTRGSEPFVATVEAAAAAVLGSAATPRALPFYTDASAFQPHLRCPAVILGPGEPSVAHRTDEYCEVARIHQAVAIYADVIHRWCEAA